MIEGDTFSLTCEVSGDPEPNVTWITVSNDEHSYGNILSFTNITRGDSGHYTCETKNRCGSESRNESINVFCKFWDENFGLNGLTYIVVFKLFIWQTCRGDFAYFLYRFFSSRLMQ